MRAGQAALQHNAGLGGVVVVSILRRADGAGNKMMGCGDVAKATGLAYNPAVEARGTTTEQADKVKSRRRSKWAEAVGPLSRSAAQI